MDRRSFVRGCVAAAGAAGDKVARGFRPWFLPLVGEEVRADHFAPGAGASFVWRSRAGEEPLTGVLVRAPSEAAFDFAPPRILPPGRALTEPEAEVVRARFLHLGPEGAFVAAASFCPHFCCVPGWKETRDAAPFADAVNGGSAWDRLFCTCHDSIYHPFPIVRYAFRPEG